MIYADQMPPATLPFPVTLVLVSVVAGLVMMLAFRLVSRPAAIRRAKRRMQAQLLALRLFGDEPALIWKAQTGLLAANARYLGVMLPPIAAAALPFLLAWPYLEALYGRASLPVGAETVLTVRLRQNHLPPQPRVQCPAGLRAVTPPVRVEGSGEISWGLRAEGTVSGPVRIRLEGAEVTRSVSVGSGGGYLDETTSVSSPEVRSVSVLYPGARLSLAGVTLPWEVWLIAISMIVALAAKNRLGVVF
jgi:hypothetical protein